jgi:uncharacterized integral membrane protein (TIGR00698 family)
MAIILDQSDLTSKFQRLKLHKMNNYTIPAHYALILGIILSQFLILSNEKQAKTKKWSSKILQYSVVLLGASLNFRTVIQEGAQGAILTLISLIAIFSMAFLLNRLFKLEDKLKTLITMGTAICGGSAIGALSPVINAPGTTIAVAMGSVFILNSLSVFIFPGLGTFFNLTQTQFGVWAALAIHDTSSVVAASSLYGDQALAVGTSIKLTRALWIIPVTFIFSLRLKKHQSNKTTIPWFIGAFLGVSLIFTFIEIPLILQQTVIMLSKNGFAITLFLIGLGFNKKMLKEVGKEPFLFATLLWIIVSVTTLMYTIYHIQ